MSSLPKASGLYNPQNERDNCGIGFVTNIKGKASHSIVREGLEVLINLMHRGAEGADQKTGDGAGITIQIPRSFYIKEGFDLPPSGQFGTGLLFLPRNNEEASFCEDAVVSICKEEGIDLIDFRDVPVNDEVLGDISRNAEPVMKQIFLSSQKPQQVFERKLYVARKRIENYIRESNLQEKDIFHIVSLSTRTIVYKGMVTSEQLGEYFYDLQNSNVQSAIALVHSRYSTNTFPSWDLAQPFRILCHNGEINTVKGNQFWMKAREALLKSDLLGDDLQKILPIIEPEKSDSAMIDNAMEFLVHAGKSLPHAVSMLIPESWNEKNPIPADVKAFYEYHSTFMEPWDGPAALLFTDGRYVGGLLDRNGLRPSRYYITKDDHIVMALKLGFKISRLKILKKKDV